MKLSYDLSNMYVGQNGYGMGIFAKVDIKKGEHIFTLKGTLRQGYFPWYVGQRWTQIDKDKWIDPDEDSGGYYINHSCNPNAGIKGSVDFVAMRDIKKGEEVVYDYSTTESEDGWMLPCQCQCGDKSCRHIIRCYEFLPEELKVKYADYISEYLKGETKK